MKKPGEIVQFPAGGDLEITARDFDRPPRTCAHRRIGLVDNRKERYPYCRDCQQTLDPMMVLLRYARSDDKLRRDARAWRDLQNAWAWLLDHDGGISISKKGGVRARAMVNGAKLTRAPFACDGGLATLIVRAIRNLVPWSDQREDWMKRHE